MRKCCQVIATTKVSSHSLMIHGSDTDIYLFVLGLIESCTLVILVQAVYFVLSHYIQLQIIFKLTVVTK